jgi:hypothetical protein
MLQKSAKLWREIWNRSGRGIPIASLLSAGLCEAAELWERDDFDEALGELEKVGAVCRLSGEELADIERGRSVPGNLLVFTARQGVTFIRVESPEVLHTRLLAQISQLATRNPASQDEELRLEEKYASKAAIRAIITKLAISPEELAEAVNDPLIEGSFFYLITPDFLVDRWKKWKQQGETDQMMRVAALLARIVDGQSRTERRRVYLAAAIEYVSKVIEIWSTDGPCLQRVREPIPEAVRHEVWRRDQGRCVKCATQENLEFDHIIPHSKGGADTARNIQLLCERCNRTKSDSI